MCSKGNVCKQGARALLEEKNNKTRVYNTKTGMWCSWTFSAKWAAEEAIKRGHPHNTDHLVALDEYEEREIGIQVKFYKSFQTNNYKTEITEKEAKQMIAEEYGNSNADRHLKTLKERGRFDLPYWMIFAEPVMSKGFENPLMETPGVDR